MVVVKFCWPMNTTLRHAFCCPSARMETSLPQLRARQEITCTFVPMPSGALRCESLVWPSQTARFAPGIASRIRRPNAQLFAYRALKALIRNLPGAAGATTDSGARGAQPRHAGRGNGQLDVGWIWQLRVYLRTGERGTRFCGPRARRCIRRSSRWFVLREQCDLHHLQAWLCWPRCTAPPAGKIAHRKLLLNNVNLRVPPAPIQRYRAGACLGVDPRLPICFPDLQRR